MILRAASEFVKCTRDFYLPRADLEALQLKRLKRTVRLAFDNVPHFHSVLRALGKVPSDFAAVRDLQTIPVISKDTSIKKRPQMVSRKADARFARASTGTTGNVVSVAYDSFFRDITIALQARHLTHFGLRPWKRLVSVRSPAKYWRKVPMGARRGSPITWADELGITVALGRATGRFLPLQAAPDNPSGDLERLLELRPDFIMCQPSHLVRMSGYIPQGKRGEVAEGMNLLNETFTESAAKRIEDAYGGGAFNSLGSNELGVSGADCRFKRGMHLNEDWILFEVLKDGEPVSEGEQGELVATVFSNDTMPLIRYATGDTVELADADGCECGSRTMRLRRILGRKDDWLLGADGALIPPMEIAEEVESRFDITDYQIVQRGPRDFVVKTVDPDNDEKRLSEQLGGYLSQRIGATVDISFSPRPREELWLKNRPVVCEIR